LQSLVRAPRSHHKRTRTSEEQRGTTVRTTEPNETGHQPFAQVSDPTGRAAGVAAAAGPFRAVSVTPRIHDGANAWPMTVVGRGDHDGPVDDLTLTAGRWATRPGEIVLTDASLFPTLGLELTFPGLPGAPTLKVVGTARSVTQSADAWVTPAQVTELSTPDRPAATRCSTASPSPTPPHRSRQTARP